VQPIVGMQITFDFQDAAAMARAARRMRAAPSPWLRTPPDI